MLKIINTASDAAVAERIGADFRQAGYEVGTGALDYGDVAILVLSPAANADSSVQGVLIEALDLSLHIVPVITQATALPKLIDHLDVIDMTQGYDFAALRKQVDVELSPEAPMPMRVRTPMVKRSNRAVGLVVAAAALLMFIIGLIAVGVYHIQAPIQEFNSVDTEVALTVAKVAGPALQIYAQFLPESSEEAANYLPTLLAVPTVYRPLVAMTATAVAANAARARGN